MGDTRLMILRPGMLWVSPVLARFSPLGQTALLVCGGQYGGERPTFKACRRLIGEAKGYMHPTDLSP